eukprot:10645330-Alexandrium_andersonii.AAC.1
MLGISEISGMIAGGEVTVDELRTAWAGMPSQGGFIDALAFEDFLHQLDELFEQEEEELGDLNSAGGEVVCGASSSHYDGAAPGRVADSAPLWRGRAAAVSPRLAGLPRSCVLAAVRM